MAKILGEESLINVWFLSCAEKCELSFIFDSSKPVLEGKSSEPLTNSVLVGKNGEPVTKPVSVTPSQPQMSYQGDSNIIDT